MTKIRAIVVIVCISLATLIALEFLLTFAGASTFYPTSMPQYEITESPWWACDEIGCHYVQEAASAACELGQLSGRPCLVNRQGFYDTDDFESADAIHKGARILVLGDSFTFGMSAELGRSYVETFEADLPDGVVWNAGIPGTGTQQALVSFDVFAPRLNPQLTILGFFTNDFDDNLMPLDSWVNALDAGGKAVIVRKYRIDNWENLIALDLQAIQLLTVYGKIAPASALEKRVASTRLGTLALRLVETLRESSATAEPLNRRIELTRRYLADLRDAVSARASTLLVLLIPRPEEIASSSRRFDTALRLMEELKIAHIDLRQVLDADSDYIPPPDFHWNSSGHQKVGRLLSACVASFVADGGWSDCEHVLLP